MGLPSREMSGDAVAQFDAALLGGLGKDFGEVVSGFDGGDVTKSAKA